MCKSSKIKKTYMKPNMCRLIHECDAKTFANSFNVNTINLSL